MLRNIVIKSKDTSIGVDEYEQSIFDKSTIDMAIIDPLNYRGDEYDLKKQVYDKMSPKTSMTASPNAKALKTIDPRTEAIYMGFSTKMPVKTKNNAGPRETSKTKVNKLIKN